MQDSKGYIWFATDNGVSRFNGYEFTNYDVSDGLAKNTVFEIFEDHHGKIWFQGLSNKLSVFDYDTNLQKKDRNATLRIIKLPNKLINQLENIQQPYKKKGFLNTINIKSIVSDPVSGVWLACSSGLYKVEGQDITYHSSIDDNWQERTYAVISNTNGSLWLGTFSGLWKYKNGEYIHYGKKNKLLKHRINALLKYKNKLIVGTKGAGLIIYDLINENTQALYTQDGLTSNSITSITKYKDMLWVGTNKGINILNLKENGSYSIKQFDQGNGLLSNEINKLYVYDSVLYVASKKGVNYLNLKKFKLPTKLLKTYIEKVRIGNTDTTVQQNYKINHAQNFINISYRAVSFKSNKNILYRYKMYPIVTNWTYTNKGELQFTSLDPGTYKFIVSAQNQSGDWNNEETTLGFTINAPFWQTLWFITLLIAIGILLTLTIIHIKLQQVKKENKLKSELNLYMKKAINSQINPHFVFNSLNSINQYILKNDKINSSKYLNRFSIYIQSILNALKSDFQSLSQEIRISELYLELEKFRLKEKLSYHFEIDKSVKSLNVLIPSLIITPFLENSIWLGILPMNGLGKTEVNLSQKNNKLNIMIRDNGIGRNESLKQQSKPDLDQKNPGSQNAMDRIKLLNKLYSDKIDIVYHDIDKVDANSGTIVNISINLKLKNDIKSS